MTNTIAHIAPQRVWTPWRIGALVLALVTLIAGLGMFSTRAAAVLTAVVENGLPGHLSLNSDPAQPVQFMDMSPGSVEYWQISAHLIDPTSPLTMQFKRDGALVEHPNGLVVEADLCSVEWNMLVPVPTCAGLATPVFGPAAAGDDAIFGPETANLAPLTPGAPPVGNPVYDLGTITNAADKFLLVTLSIEDTPEAQADESLMGIESTLGFGFTAMGEDDDLARTGAVADILGGILAALGAIGLGLVLVSARRVRISLNERNGS